MEQLDQVYVVSDLHLGGATGRQIFKGESLLRELMLLIARHPADRRVALVINGDFVDFLAEPGARYFDPTGAAEKLARIFRDPTFVPVCDGMRELARTPNRRLIIVLGNHDIELALPDAQTALRDIIAGDDDAARGRISFSVMGAGFSARVGNARVLCLHGNEVDPFNTTNYEQLRRLARDQEFGRAFDGWTPNAGTKLVIDVMNGIKRDRPFIDLLKPETDAVVPVLFAFDQVNVDRILGAMEIAVKMSWDATRRAAGFLSEAEMVTAVAAAAAASPASPEMRQELTDASRAAADLMTLLSKAYEVPPNTGEEKALVDLIDETEERFRKGVDPLQLAPGDLEDRLGAWNLTKAAVKAGWSKLIRRTPCETLRAALQHLRQDRSFDPSFEDDDFRRIDQIVPVGIEYVIAGHTHLRRAHPRGSGKYINTGTWARLINLDAQVLDDADIFQQFYDALRSPSLDELDRARVRLPDGGERAVVIHQPSVAVVELTAGGTVGTLREVRAAAEGVTLVEVTR